MTKLVLVTIRGVEERRRFQFKHFMVVKISHLLIVLSLQELYNELQAMDRIFEQDYQRKRLEEDNPFATQRGEFAVHKPRDIQ